MAKTFHRQRGDLGEELVCQHLKAKGFDCLEHNFTTRYGEIDLIHRKQDRFYFIEVKTRREGNQVSSNLFLPSRKRQRILQSIYQYLEAFEEEQDWEAQLWAVTLCGNQAELRCFELSSPI